MPLSSVLGAQSLVRPGVCTSSTRPASPFEGQVIYETDTDLVSVYNGSAWKSIGRVTASTNGSILQVVQTVKTNTFDTTSTSFTDITGLTATITPTASSSKVLILAQVSGNMLNQEAYLRINGGNASTYIGDAAGSRTRAASSVSTVAGLANRAVGFNLTYLDSPGTTSATTYAIQAMVISGGTFYLNRGTTDADNSSHVRAASSITLMEIAG